MYKAYMTPDIDAILNKIESSCGFEATEWLKQTLDPRHHKILGRTPVGAPSKDLEPILVFAETFTFPVSQPFGFPATSPWTYAIQLFSDQYTSTYGLHNRDQNLVVPVIGSIDNTHGGVICLANHGTPNIQWSDGVALPLFQSAINGQLSAYKGRTTALCIKVEDTTPPLYDGGAVHAARHNEGDSDESTTYQVGVLPASYSAVQVREAMSFPLNTAQLASLPGYVNHKAKEGAMSCAIVDPFVQSSVPDFTHWIYESDIPATEPNVNQVIFPRTRPSTIVGLGSLLVPIYRNCHSGIKPMQIWFENVQPQHTAVVTIDRITEVSFAANAPGQIQNIALLRKATPWCQKAMDIMVVLNRNAKATGLASDNKNFLTLRKMFQGAGGDIQDILGSIPHPIAQGASAFLDMFGSGQGTPAMQGTRVVQNSQPVRRTVKAPRLPARTPANYAPVGQGPFAGITYPTNRPFRRELGGMANVATNYAPVTTKTLKNRKKREKAKIKRTMRTL